MSLKCIMTIFFTGITDELLIFEQLFFFNWHRYVLVTVQNIKINVSLSDFMSNVMCGNTKYLIFFQTSITESIELLQDHTSSIENEEESGIDPNASSLKQYFQATNSNLMNIIVLLSFILTQAFASSADFWVAFW